MYIRRFTLGIGLLVLTACATSRNERLHLGIGPAAVVETDIARLQDPAEQLRVQQASIEKHPEFTLGVVEFNDEGLAFSREQRNAVVKMIRDTSAGKSAIIVTFIHGWKHNATVCDDNLACFRGVLQYLGQRERTTGGNRPVIGVYVGWRGLTYCNVARKQLSIWTRKRIGERLGTNQARRFIERLILAYNDIKKEPGGQDTRFVAVGHSLGAGVLFSAVGPAYRQALHDALTERADAAQIEVIDGYQDENGRHINFPDLVVLANPAFEAELYKRTPVDLAKMRDLGLRFNEAQLPLLLTISSKSDGATRVIFPIGQGFKALVSPIMWIRGTSYLTRNVITAANFQPYVTDVARAVAPVSGRSSSGEQRPSNCFTGSFQALTGANCDCDALVPLRKAMETPQQEAVIQEGFQVRAAPRQYGNVELIPQGENVANNPFLVVTADRSVLNGHGDIYNPTFMSLLIDLVRRVDATKKKR